VGLAYVPLPSGGRSINIVLDADLTTTATAAGDQRHLAGGVELWAHRRLGVRGGFTVNTVGDLRPTFSAGVSAAVRPSLFLEAAATHGDGAAARNSWGIGARATF
jgi:hypothetical protein